MSSDLKKEKIAAKNDACRRTFTGCRVMLTAGVEGDVNLDKVIQAVKTFDDFNEDNDPYLEHDFGKFTIEDEDYFWKVDYYDKDYNFFQEDGYRVLTIMRSDEY